MEALVTVSVMEKTCKIEKSANGNNVVLKYNEEFKMWVKLEFVGADDFLEEDIIAILSKQFIQAF